MNAKQYHQALNVSTAAALKSGQITLPEIIGLLHMTAINVERQAFTHAMKAEQNGVNIIASSILPGPPPRN